MSDYDLGRHDERRRTMQLIGGVRMDAQTGAAGDVLDRLVTCIASEPLPDVRPNAVPLGVIELLNAAMLHPESAEGNIRQVIEMLTTTPAVPLDARECRVDYLLSVIKEDLQRLQQPDPTATQVSVVTDDALTHLGMLQQAIAAALTTTPAGWQPIETAPKGREVLMVRANGKCFIGDWGDYEKYNGPTFTHWMPLPPTTNAATGAQTCPHCVAGIPKEGEYLHDLTPQLAPNEAHAYKKCANAPATTTAAEDVVRYCQQSIPFIQKVGFVESALAATPSISEAIAERALKAALHTIEGYRHGNASHDLADEVLPLIREALQPSTPSEKEKDS